MTYPPPGYPVGVPGNPPARLRGRAQLRIGITLLSVGLVLLIVGIIVLATESLTKVNDFQRISLAQGIGSVRFSHAGGYIAYYEAAGVSESTTEIPLVGVQLTSPSGTRIIVDTPYGGRSDNKIKSLKYQYNGHHGAALYQFHISEAGTYQVTLTPNTRDAADADIAFGKSIATGVALGAIPTVLGVMLLLAGLIVLIVGLVKRRGHKKELASGSSYYGGQWPQQQGGQWPSQQQQGGQWARPPDSSGQPGGSGQPGPEDSPGAPGQGLPKT